MRPSNNKNDLKIFEDNSFAMIFSIIALQHVEKKQAINYIKEFVRITEPGGLLALQLPIPLKIPFKKLRTYLGHIKRHFQTATSNCKSSYIPMNHYGLEEQIVVNVLNENCKIIEIDRKSPLEGFNYDRRYYAIKK